MRKFLLALVCVMALSCAALQHPLSSLDRARVALNATAHATEAVDEAAGAAFVAASAGASTPAQVDALVARFQPIAETLLLLEDAERDAARALSAAVDVASADARCRALVAVRRVQDLAAQLVAQAGPLGIAVPAALAPAIAMLADVAASMASPACPGGAS